MDKGQRTKKRIVMCLAAFQRDEWQKRYPDMKGDEALL